MTPSRINKNTFQALPDTGILVCESGYNDRGYGSRGGGIDNIKVFTNERMGIQVPRIVRVFGGEERLQTIQD